jgi:hypothetical protein
MHPVVTLVTAGVEMDVLERRVRLAFDPVLEGFEGRADHYSSTQDCEGCDMPAGRLLRHDGRTAPFVRLGRSRGQMRTSHFGRQPPIGWIGENWDEAVI